ncbi:MAG: ribosome maturation factor RimP [Alphaproteobacteria bacterium]|nr:ribosome maturation factor RimP [Alphaproteobacteria bacterium]NCQ87922.1 ribosome maturation factor RimP [Alphaproteobacteria bacterium]NCT05571.1 ribosome maturation factor RimP [Alphaproteobacteria bacterium]
MRLSSLEKKIDGIIRPVIEELGFDLIWIEFAGGALQIYAQDPNTGNLSLKNCSDISREISPLLEVEDPIEGRYRLEVSSPGIDRMLVREQDYERYIGCVAKIELDMPLDGQKRFRGTIEGLNDGEIALKTDTGLVNLRFSDISKAKLVMTDELIKISKALMGANDNKTDTETPQDNTNTTDTKNDN